MYGPPPDPRQILAPLEVVDAPVPYLVCVGVGLALTLGVRLRRLPMPMRAFLFFLGQVVFFTMPLAAVLDRFWYGSYPTTDKEGSLLFYLDGVHVRALLHPLASLSDPAVQLIGVHLGHLWLVSFFDLFLTPMGAFNALALLSPALGCLAAWLLLREVCGDARVAALCAFPFGFGLHVFRDLNWYTIEKAAVFWLALFAWALYRAWREGGRWPWIAGALFAVMSWMNLYLGLVGAALGGLALVGAAARAWQSTDPQVRAELRGVAHACLASALLVSPLVAMQAALMAQAPPLATHDAFVWQRAAQDSLTIRPLAWDRLELHRALNAAILALAGIGAVQGPRDPRVRYAVLAGAALTALALGPRLAQGVPNPIYLGLVAVLPGFWRVAKPEVFFQGTWLLLCALATLPLMRLPAPRRHTAVAWLYIAFAVAWVIMVRTHPAYPPMTRPVQSHLAPDWAARVFGDP